MAGRPQPVASMIVWFVCCTMRMMTGVGSDRMKKARSVERRSPRESRRTAAIMPNRIPRKVPIAVPITTRRRLIGIRVASSSITGTIDLLVPVVTPKSPRTRPPSQFA